VSLLHIQFDIIEKYNHRKVLSKWECKDRGEKRRRETIVSLCLKITFNDISTVK